MDIRLPLLMAALTLAPAGAWAQSQPDPSQVAPAPMTNAQSAQPSAPQRLMAPGSGPGQAPAPSPAGLDVGDDIRDVRTVELEPPVNWVLWGSVAAAVAVLLAALAGYLILRARKTPLLPHERALLDLEEARARARPGEGRNYAYAVSEIVRTYIEERFKTRAVHSTTEEFLYELLQNPNAALAGYTDALREFMEGCDLAKFAGVQLDQDGIDRFHITALNFIRATAPRKQGDPEPVLQEMRPSSAAESPAPTDTDNPLPVADPLPAGDASLEAGESVAPGPGSTPQEEEQGDHPDSRYQPR
ncbi:MAG: hypothetical protein AAGK14_03190 [Verrucomicrobiota bacterium]